MKKRLLSILLTACLLVGLLPTVALAEDTSHTVTFSPGNDCTRAQIVTFLFRCLGGE